MSAERTVSLAEFFAEYGEAAAGAIVGHFPPRYDREAARRHAPSIRRLRRRPLGAQRHAIGALADALRYSPFALLVGEMGTGKAQPLTARVLTPTGWRAMGDLAVGDPISNAQGGTSRVIGVYPQGEKEIYRVTFSDGSSTECCADHLWLTNSSPRKWREQPGRVWSLREIALTGHLFDGAGNARHFVPLVQPVEFAAGPLPLDPYLLGLLLGDGTLSHEHAVGFSTGDDELVAAVRALLPPGCCCCPRGDRRDGDTLGCDYTLVGRRIDGRRQPDGVLLNLRELGLLGRGARETFIPESYQFAPSASRLALLQGLLDTDGSTTGKPGAIEYTTISRTLAEDVRSLVQSLGGTARIGTKETRYTHLGEKCQSAMAYRLYISLPNTLAPFRLGRKAARYRARTKYPPARALVRVELVGRKEARCIAVDAPDRLYITDDFIVTHNTMISAAAAWAAGHRRSLILCPTHLVQKWQREVEATVPGARAVILRDAAAVAAFGRLCRAAPEATSLYGIISKETAKLGAAWRPAYREREVAYRDEERGLTLRVRAATCPDCGATAVDKEGVPLPAGRLAAKRHFCRACRGALWSYGDSGRAKGFGAAVAPRDRFAHWSERVAAVAMARGWVGAAAGPRRWRWHQPGLPYALPPATRQGGHRWPLAATIERELVGLVDVFIADECFPGDTPVLTPSGQTEIARLRVGDLVLSHDGSGVVERRVTNVFRNPLRQSLVRVTHKHGQFVCTPNHRIFTVGGVYVEASRLQPGRHTLLTACCSDRGGGCDADHREDVFYLREHVHLLAPTPPGAGDVQPAMRGATPEGARRSAPAPGEPATAPHAEAAGAGCAQGRDADRARPAPPAFLECGDHQQPGGGRRREPRYRTSQVLSVEVVPSGEQWVYDIEVEGSHCYFARGVLVHNCHKFKAKGSAQGQAYAALARTARHTLAATGTLLGGYSSTLFYVLQRADPAMRAEFGFHEEERWISRYGIWEEVRKKARRDVEVLADGAQSDRKEYTSVTVRERPGIHPALLLRLLPRAVFVRLADVAPDLPPYREYPVLVDMAPEQRAMYLSLERQLREALMAALQAGSKRLLGAYLQTLLSWPDNPRPEAVADGEAGAIAASVDGLPTDRVYPKEEYLLDLADDARRRGRRLLVYCAHTGSRDLTARLARLLTERGHRVATLRAESVPAERREAWVEARVAEGIGVLIANPRCVETGLDLLAFESIVWMELDYSSYVLRQASRRSWRIGAVSDVEVHYLCYAETLQASALALMQAKIRASLLLEGELPEGGFTGEADDDLFAQLARQLSSGAPGGFAGLFADTHEAELRADAFLEAAFLGEDEPDAAAHALAPGDEASRPAAWGDDTITTHLSPGGSSSRTGAAATSPLPGTDSPATATVPRCPGQLSLFAAPANSAAGDRDAVAATTTGNSAADVGGEAVSVPAGPDSGRRAVSWDELATLALAERGRRRLRSHSAPPSPHTTRLPLA